MATYHFSPNGALDTGAELQAVTQKLLASLDDLNAKVNAFLSANASASADTYHAAQAGWNTGHEELNRALAKGIGALNEIHHEYVLADNRGAQVFDMNL